MHHDVLTLHYQCCRLKTAIYFFQALFSIYALSIWHVDACMYMHLQACRHLYVHVFTRHIDTCTYTQLALVLDGSRGIKGARVST